MMDPDTLAGEVWGGVLNSQPDNATVLTLRVTDSIVLTLLDKAAAIDPSRYGVRKRFFLTLMRAGRSVAV